MSNGVGMHVDGRFAACKKQEQGGTLVHAFAKNEPLVQFNPQVNEWPQHCHSDPKSTLGQPENPSSTSCVKYPG